MALKKNANESQETVAKTYLSPFYGRRFTWQTMDKSRMIQIFKNCLESKQVKPNTKQKIMEVLTENFM